MRTQREYLQTINDDETIIQALLIQPFRESTKISGLIRQSFPLQLGKPSIYRLERHKIHEKMRDMVEDMAS
jgi:hypothetical protein